MHYTTDCWAFTHTYIYDYIYIYMSQGWMDPSPLPHPMVVPPSPPVVWGGNRMFDIGMESMTRYSFHV